MTDLPDDDRPFWLRGAQPLAGWRSHAVLPAMVDTLIIGAGLIGASAAYHLAAAARRDGLRVAVIERGDAGNEASGRNAGHFEMIPENSLGPYEGLVRERSRFIDRHGPRLPSNVLRAEAERQAAAVLGLALRNRRRLCQIVQRHGLACDLAPSGWLFLAGTAQEEGLREEAGFVADHGARVELWSPDRIRSETGIRTSGLGRFVPGDGTYNPFKYLCGLLRYALDHGVELYTRLPVLRITSSAPDCHHVDTPEGTIVTRRIIVAANAYIRELLPELHAIEPRQSQIMVTEDAPDRLRGRCVTSDRGPVYFNQPRSGAGAGRAPLLIGGGADRPMRDPRSRCRSLRTHQQLLGLRDRYFPELRGRPPSAEWIGPMAFTPDQLPVLGLVRPGVIVAMACNGYGGSYTTAAGEAAARLASTGALPAWASERVLSPRRLLTRLRRRHLPAPVGSTLRPTSLPAPSARAWSAAC